MVQLERVVRASIVAPGVVPAAVLVFAVSGGVALTESILVAAIYAAFTYGTALVIGIPAHFALSRHGWTQWWHYALAGSVAGIAVLCVVFLLSRNTAGSVMAFLVFGGSGAVSATVFWALATTRERRVRS